MSTSKKRKGKKLKEARKERSEDKIKYCNKSNLRRQD